MAGAEQVLLVAGVEQVALREEEVGQVALQGRGEGEEVPLEGQEVEEGPLLLQTMQLAGG